METVNTTEILGSDSISGSRTTINSNFLLLQNWINGYITVFGVDSTNGILDLTAASTGKVAAKIGAFNSIAVPATGTPKGSVNSAGQAAFTDLSSTTLTVSGSVALGGAVTLGTNSFLTVGGTASYNGTLGANSFLVFGPNGNVISQNTTYATGLTAGSAFPQNSYAGGGYYTTVNSPYSITGLEDVIYANCSGPTGFYIQAATGSGANVATIPAGSRLTIVNTAGGTGYIWTGVTGSSSYYTGFNTSTNYGGYATGGIVVSLNKSYRSSVTLQWEPRIAQDQTTQRGSWVVLSSTNVTV